MRETAVKELGLEMKMIKDKAKLSKFLVAFEVAKARSSRMTELEGEAAVKKLPKALPTPDFQGMREAYDKKFLANEDRKVPSRACIAKKLESVEKNGLKVEPIIEITNMREDEGNESFEPIWDPQEGLVSVGKTANVELPQIAEDFRYRVMLIGTCWSFVAIQQTNRKYHAPPTVVVGPFGLVVGRDGLWRGVESGWSCGLRARSVMESHVVIRIRDMGRRVQESERRASWVDSVVKERFFTTPLCWEAIETAERRADSLTRIPCEGAKDGKL